MGRSLLTRLPPYLRKPALGRPLSYHVPVNNESGTTIPDGATVLLDLTETVAHSKLCMKAAAVINGLGVQGVTVGAIANHGKGIICVYGAALSLVSDDAGDVAVGDQLVTSDHGAGFAGKAGAMPLAGTVLGYAMAAQTGDSVAGTASSRKLVFVDPH